jgi:putative transcriptional regulator
MSSDLPATPPSPAAHFNLSNHFLIATPAVEGDMFEKSLVYLCQHTENGALGLIVNKPTEIALAKLFEQVDLPLERSDLQQAMVLEGGPLHAERGFVLHERMQAISAEPPSIVQADEDGQETIYTSTLLVPGSNLELTTSTDIMHAIAQGGGPRQVLVALGFASWGGGQLEEELANNAWLALDAGGDPEGLLFATPPEDRYGAALKRLGLESWMLGAGAGRA